MLIVELPFRREDLMAAVLARVLWAATRHADNHLQATIKEKVSNFFNINLGTSWFNCENIPLIQCSLGWAPRPREEGVKLSFRLAPPREYLVDSILALS